MQKTIKQDQDKLKELQSELETTENMDIDANIKNVKMASLKININSINDKLIRITKEDISKIKTEKAFPKTFMNYVSYLEKELQVPIAIISVGPDRNQTIIR